MLKLKHTYILLILTFIVAACGQTKFVPEGEYLLKKNDIIQSGDHLDKNELRDILRQPENYKSFGIKWKLMAFNRVDSIKVADKRYELNERIRIKNRNRLARQDRVNSGRMDRAIKKGQTHYTQKIVSLKDTVTPNMFFREWYKYKIGRPPVVFDSIPYNKTIEQFSAYLRSKGYYYGNVTGFVDYKDNGKCVVTYHLETGPLYTIDSVYIIADNPLVVDNYQELLKRKDEHPLEGKPFDTELLDDHRDDVATHMRNASLYGFSSNHITFIVDTNKRDMTVELGVKFGDRYIKSVQYNDSIIRVPHQMTYVNGVYFHIADSIHYEGDFQKKLDELGLSLFDGQFMTTIDTTMYTHVKHKKTDELDISRMAVFMHNGRLMIRPKILEAQNYLEMDELYAEKYLENTYLSLLQLDLFSAVKAELQEVEGTGCVDAHYYLVPSKKQSFSFEPRGTNSNGFLGVAATINYVNRNLFRGAEKLTLSLSGGFESQPPIFDETIDGEKIKTAARSFNTFEFGPSLSLDLPGLFPLRMTNLYKKLRPKTIISTAYNFQRRDDFTRGTFQLNYMWRFHHKKTMIFHSGLPIASVIKFVNIDKSDEFTTKLDALNDRFLLNAYSNQFIWQDWEFTFEYNIKDKEHRKGNSQLYFRSSFEPAGNFLSLFSKTQSVDSLSGQRTILGVPYAQFVRLDNELIFSKPLGRDLSLNFRFEAGAGVPYGNTTTSLPYDYSFFAGGANDNRGWRARSLGPGSYKYYLDTNRTATQIGDLRLGASVEFRFAFNSLFKGAFFVDAGNVWTMNVDTNRVGGNISSNWYKEIALAAGVGIRLDLGYFIVRVDLGLPLYNPALPDGSKWIFEPRDAYYSEGEAKFGANYEDYLPLPFVPKFHFGIGYPF
ncbi:MAG: BamA/TamA family outer membrane protein [Crocinitomicaceae bacterium]|nr:BamA/TamA family outer membrane protein [Crocinitomicaceae bacterium]